MVPDDIIRLTTTEVCALARISRTTLWRRIRAGRMPKKIDQANEALFSADEVFAVLRRPHAGPTSHRSNEVIDAAVNARVAELTARQTSAVLRH